MSEPLERIASLPPKKLALLAWELQSKLQAMEQARREPIAVIGLGCRFPGGADSPESYWSLLSEGRDAIGEVPPSRWDIGAYYDPDPDVPGKMSTRYGGFLKDVDQFDPQFFGLAPREAQSMDPQQRLLLEVCWEALEHAGQSPEKLHGTHTGVFVGISGNDYQWEILRREDPAALDVYLATGVAHSVASGRVSYLLGLHGPSFAIDTACSSSLVAVHEACLSLRAGECRMALAGGVNLILSPEVTIALSRGRMMAPDGRCKTFDARGDGFVRGEGCGIVVLKRLADAQVDGDRVLAVVRGTAINQDGRSSGLTAPNGPAQEDVIRKAMADGGIDPHQVDYVETHGTGTPLGDPIEVRSLAAVLSEGRPKDRPLLIGSVKTNIGHAESAAGVAGLIKVVLALQCQVIPPHLHFREPNPYIPWADMPLLVPTARTPWPRSNGPRIAGVSSFGFSGTNVHMVLEEAPVPPPVQSAMATMDRPGHLFTLSAKSQAALLELVGRYTAHLATHPAEALGDLCFTANTGRAHFAHRLALVAASSTELNGKLAALPAAGAVPGVLRGQAPTTPREVAFLFTGHGAQYPGMGRELYATQPTFRAALDRCAVLLQGQMDRPLLDVLFGEGRLLDEMGYAQPALFALQWALTELWRSWGIEPAVVMGHSAGEFAAATVAGVLSLEDGLRLIAARARLMQGLPRDGAMVSLLASEARARAAIAPYGSAISIAAVNGPESVVISGQRTALEQVVRDLEGAGVKTKTLAVPVASHSPLMDPILDAFERVAAGIQYQAPRLGLVSNLTGQVVKAGEIDAAYWRRHLREAVRFQAGMEALREQGCQMFVEIGPHPVLLGMGPLCLPEGYGTWLPTLRKERGPWDQVLESLGSLYVGGMPVDWAGFDRDYQRRKVALPTYPFQRERYWVESHPAASQGRPRRARPATLPHPLCGERLRSALPTFEQRLGARTLPFLGEHRVFGVAVASAPVLAEMAFEAAEALGIGPHVLEDLTLHEAMTFPDEGERTVQIVLTPERTGTSLGVQIFSLDPGVEEPDATWTLHATGTLRSAAPLPEKTAADALDAVRQRCPVEYSPSAFYQALQKRWADLGPVLQVLQTLRRGQNEALGLVALDRACPCGMYRVHPALLDGCLQVLAAAGLDMAEETAGRAHLLVGIDRVSLVAEMPDRIWSHGQLRTSEDGNLVGDVHLHDETGCLVGEVSGVRLKQATRESLLRAVQLRIADWFYEVEWIEKGLAGQRLIRPAADGSADPTEVARRVGPRFAEFAREQGLGFYDEFLPRLEALSGCYLWRALRELGWDPQPGDTVRVSHLAERLGVGQQHRRLFARLLEMLAEDGLLRRLGDGDDAYEVVRPLPDPADPERQRTALIERYPDGRPELTMIGRCGPRLAEVIRGACDPLQLLFPDGSFAAAEDLYQGSPLARVYNATLREAVTAALPPGRSYRVLEVGAGTGGSTSAVLPLLPEGCAEYVFTDLSRLFTLRAAQKFSRYPFLRTEILDIEQDPVAQGFAAQAFDLILAANVLHATRNLRQSLAHVKKLLAPGGVIVLLEGTAPHRWVDITFGLTEGWWRFADTAVRPSYPLLAPDRWLALLREAGFDSPAVIPEDPAYQAVVLARNPAAAHPEATPAVQVETSGSWLVLGDQGGLGRRLAERVRRGGGKVLYVAPVRVGGGTAPDDCVVDPACPEDFRGAVETARELAPGGGLQVVYLWGLDAGLEEQMSAEALKAVQVEAGMGFLHLLRALAAEPSDAARLWVVTRGAQKAGPSRFPAGPTQATLWGLARTAALEQPGLWGGLVDLDPGGTQDEALALLVEIARPDGEDQVAFRDGTRRVARLVRRSPPAGSPPQWRPDGRYLVTGGLGVVGLALARWLAERGARHLVLAGRRGLPAPSAWSELPPESEAGRRAAAVRAIESLGVTVEVVAVDVADESGMRDLFERLRQEGPPLRGIFHLATEARNAPLESIERETLDALIRPKVMGSWLLHHLSHGLELDCFVLFSSMASLLGAVTLGHYAAASQFMDALCHERRASGLPALAVNWGLWEIARGISAEEQRSLVEMGFVPMAAGAAFEAMARLIGSGVPQAGVAAVDWSTLKGVYESLRPRPILERLGSGSVAESNGSGSRAEVLPGRGSGPSLRRQLEQAAPEERQSLVQSYLRAEAAKVLGLPVDRLDADVPLSQLGFDSLMAIQLRNAIQADLQSDLPVSRFLVGPSVKQLAEALVERLGKAEASASPPVSSRQVARAPAVRVEDLSDQDVDAALLGLLGGGSDTHEIRS